jgi:L-ascorbate metabolism protein UlaG (beta-lactamase superfamily)
MQLCTSTLWIKKTMHPYLLIITLIGVTLIKVFFAIIIFKKISKNPYYNANKPHHTTRGFQSSLYYKISLLDALKWQFQRVWQRLPKKPEHKIIGIIPNLAYLHSGHNDISVTWIGHATILLQIDGLNILTDPVFGKSISPIPGLGPKRHQAPGIELNQLPHIDIVVISHNHYDHLDLDTVIKLQQQVTGAPRFYVPLGIERWFKKNIAGVELSGNRQNVFALDWHDKLTVQGATTSTTLVFLPVQHWSARGIFDHNKTLWGSWAILNPNFNFWFSGDLGYSNDLIEIGKQIGGFDLAAIAIGAYEPRWMMANSHINPAEAVQVMLDIKAKQAFGIHWGTFENLTDESLDQPPKDLSMALNSRGLNDQDFYILYHGETRKYKKVDPKSTAT